MLTVDLLRVDGSVKTLAEVEALVIEEILVHCRYNMSKTAKELGIGRSTLYRKFERYQETRQ